MELLALIKKGEIHPTGNIIPAKDYLELLTATEVIEKAKEDVATLLEETRKECELLREEADKRGFQEGLEKLNEAILSLDAQQKKLRHELNRIILPIAITAAKKIVAKELEISPETIVDMVLQALTPATQSRQVVIYVSKEEKSILESKRPQIAAILSQVETLAIKEKSGLSSGDCLIQTEHGMINARLENQWHALEHAFHKYVQET